MASDTPKPARRGWIFALVLALHIGACWLLLKAARPVMMRLAPAALELIYLVPAPAGPPGKLAPDRHSPPPSHRGAGPPSIVQAPAPNLPSAAAPNEESNAIHPPIDWAGELTRAARETAARESAPRPREFGAPHVMVAPPPKPAEFGWSRPRTHRIERRTGASAIHLGDHCVIAFTPLPFPVCSLGETDANGDLFKHMHDPPPPGNAP